VGGNLRQKSTGNTQLVHHPQLLRLLGRGAHRLTSNHQQGPVCQELEVFGLTYRLAAAQTHTALQLQRHTGGAL